MVETRIIILFLGIVAAGLFLTLQALNQTPVAVYETSKESTKPNIIFFFSDYFHVQRKENDGYIIHIPVVYILYVYVCFGGDGCERLMCAHTREKKIPTHTYICTRTLRDWIMR